MTEPTGSLERWERIADVHAQREAITGLPFQCRCGSLWPCVNGEALNGLLALVAAQADQIARVRALLDSATELAPGSVRAYFADDIRAALDGTEATP